MRMETYKYRDGDAEEPMPKPGCKGSYTFSDGVFEGTLDCSAIGGPKGVKQVVDLSKVSVKELNSEEGAPVLVKSSLLGEEKNSI